MRARVVRLVTLSKALDDMHNRVSVMPWFSNATSEHRSYKFIVTGLPFQMFIGMMIPKPLVLSAGRGWDSSTWARTATPTS
jgi:hypothetical protein